MDAQQPKAGEQCECPTRKIIQGLADSYKAWPDEYAADPDKPEDARHDRSVTVSVGYRLKPLREIRAALLSPCPCEGMRQENADLMAQERILQGTLSRMQNVIDSLRAELAKRDAAIERLSGIAMQVANEGDAEIVRLACNSAERGGEIAKLRAELAEAKAYADRWRKAHDGILSEAARMCEETKRGADEAAAASQERERELREALEPFANYHDKVLVPCRIGDSILLTDIGHDHANSILTIHFREAAEALALAAPEGTK